MDQLGRFRLALRESPPLAWASLYFFCLLAGYYVLRPVREAMGAASDVRTVFPAAMADWFAARGMPLEDFMLQVLFTCTFLIMIVLQPVYGALVSRYPRRVFLPVVYGFFIVTLLLFYVAFQVGMPGRGMAYFLWITVFNLFAVAVFWSFMADVFDDAEARRLYGYIGAAGTLGSLAGNLFTANTVRHIGIANLMLAAAVMLLLCVLCLTRLRAHAVQREHERGKRSGEVPMGGSVLAGLKLVAREPLLRWMALLVISGVGVGTLLYNEQRAIALAYFPQERDSAAYFGWIDFATNALTLTVQLVATRFVLSRYGIAPALLIPGTAIILGYAALTASPLPILVAVVQVITRASEFSLAKPARETIYTRVDREWRYKAGAAIDTVIYRAGDVTFAWVHKALSLVGSVAVFGTGLLLAGSMTFGAWRLLREARKLPASAPVNDAATPTSR